MRKDTDQSGHKELIILHAVAHPQESWRSRRSSLPRPRHRPRVQRLQPGESNRYNSVVELNHGLLRVQVKSATLYADNRYRVKTAGASGKIYTSKEIDFFVGYIVPENISSIMPIPAIGQRKGIHFYPTTRRCRSKNLEVRCALCPQRG